jgi:hypothetical protein
MLFWTCSNFVWIQFFVNSQFFPHDAAWTVVCRVVFSVSLIFDIDLLSCYLDCVIYSHGQSLWTALIRLEFRGANTGLFVNVLYSHVLYSYSFGHDLLISMKTVFMQNWRTVQFWELFVYQRKRSQSFGHNCNAEPPYKLSSSNWNVRNTLHK